MSCSLKIILVFYVLCWMEIINGAPIFQGFSVNKGFEVNLKPFEFKPFSFFKERWSPFGKFGVRRGIEKRDVGDKTVATGVDSVAPAPVFENIEEHRPDKEEKSMEISFTQPQPGPDPVKRFSTNLIFPPSLESVKPTSEGLYTNIGKDISPVSNYILQNTAKPLEPMELYGELPPRPVSPIPVRPTFIPQTVSQNAVGFVSVQQGNPGQSIPSKPVGPIPFQPSFVPQMMNPQADFIPVQPASNPGPLLPKPLGTIPVQSNFMYQMVNQEAGYAPVEIPSNQGQSVPPQLSGPMPVQLGFTPQMMNQEAGFIQPASNSGQPFGILRREFSSLLTPSPAPPGGSVNVPLSEIPPTEGPLVRGSRVVLYFGNALLQLLSQFLTNARLQFSRPTPLPVPVQGQ